MADPMLKQLAPALARAVAAATGIPIAIRDARGAVLAATDEPHHFDPGATSLTGAAAERVAESRPILVGGEPAGWIETALVPVVMRPRLAQAGRVLDAVALPLAVAVAAERRERLVREMLVRRLEAARGATEGEAGRAVARALDALAALADASTPAAEVAALTVL